MQLPIDQIIHKKLFLTKQLYQHAEIQSLRTRSAVSRIMAVIGFDLAIETALKVVVSALETKVQPDKVFDSLIQQANDKLAKAGFPSLQMRAQFAEFTRFATMLNTKLHIRMRQR